MTTTTRRCGTPAMVVVDTSVWIDVFRDPSGRVRDKLKRVTGDDDTVLTRFSHL